MANPGLCNIRRDTAAEVAAMEAVDDPVWDFWCLRSCLEFGIDYLSSTKADKCKFLRSLPEEEWLNKMVPGVVLQGGEHTQRQRGTGCLLRQGVPSCEWFKEFFNTGLATRRPSLCLLMVFNPQPMRGLAETKQRMPRLPFTRPETEPPAPLSWCSSCSWTKQIRETTSSCSTFVRLWMLHAV